MLLLGCDVGVLDGCGVGPVLGCLLGEAVVEPGESVGILLGGAVIG